MAAAGGGGNVTRVLGGMVVVNPRVGGMALNFLTLRDVQPETLDMALEAGKVLLAEHGRPQALYLSPLAGEVAALSTALKTRGWTQRVHQVVLVRELDGGIPLPESAAADIRVEQIGEADLPVWGDVLTSAYEAVPAVGEDIHKAWTSLYGAPGEGAGVRYYLAWVDGFPVGTGLSWMRAGIVGLYCGAVLPAYRRRGVERATLVRRVVDARAAGATMAVLQTEVGSPVEHLCVQRLGFHPAYERTVWISAALSPAIVGNVYTVCG